MTTESQTLLAEYARNGSEPAFRELVARYLDLVYSTAVRSVGGDTHLAEDVTQIVFVHLARQARWLPSDVMLGGWLHRDTCFEAAKTMRAQRRRQAREQEAAEMSALHDGSESDLAHLGAVLDEAINQLGAADRTAILLRFFEHRDLRSVGQALGSNEDAAQKRVSRALGKLHSLLQRRGVAFSAAALGAALTTQAVTAAPPSLAVAVSGTALAQAATGGGLALTFFKLMAMTKLKLTVLGAIVVAVVAVPVVLHHPTGSDGSQENPAPAQVEPVPQPNEAATPAQADSKSEVSSRPSLSPASSRPPRLAAAAPAFRPMDEILKGQRLSAEEAQALESRLAQNPEDLLARCQLLGYYWRQQRASQSAREARQTHILWLAQHHPEMDLSLYGGLDPFLDGPAYAQARAVWIQQANDNSQNPTILGNAARFCLLHDRPTAEAFLKAAQLLEPTNPTWQDQLAQLYALDASSAKPGVPNPAAAKALEQMEKAQANTTDDMQKFANLNKLAQMAFDAHETDKAQTYALALLQEAAQPRAGWDYADAVYRGNLVLGRIALSNGQLDTAKQYLLASAKTTGSPALGSFGPNMTLAKEMLEKGEKEAVLEYFKLCSTFWKSEKLAGWAQQVQQGWIPDFGANLKY